MALALVFSSATIWSSECRTSSRLPRASKTTQTMSTLAMLTAAFRQKFCHALLKAKSMRFQSRCMVPSCILVSDNLAALDRHHPASHDIDDLSVVGRHHDRRAAGVDLQQKLDDLPRGGRVQVSSGLIGEKDPRVMNEGPGDRDALLLHTRKLVWFLVFFPFQPHNAEDFLDLRLEMTQGALGHAQREGNVLKDGQVGQQLEILEDHADLPPQVREMAPLEAAQILPLDMDGAGGGLLLANQETNQRRLAGAAGTNEKDEVLLGNFQRDVAEGDSAVGIGLLHALEADLRDSRGYRGHACLRGQQRRPCRLGRDCCWHVNKSIPKAGATAGWALAGRMTRAVEGLSSRDCASIPCASEANRAYH